MAYTKFTLRKSKPVEVKKEKKEKQVKEPRVAKAKGIKINTPSLRRRNNSDLRLDKYNRVRVVLSLSLEAKTILTRMAEESATTFNVIVENLLRRA